LLNADDRILQQYGMKEAKLRVRLIDGETALIEGDKKGLEMLGWMLLAMASSPARSFELKPEEDARADEGGELGLYLHRLNG